MHVNSDTTRATFLGQNHALFGLVRVVAMHVASHLPGVRNHVGKARRQPKRRTDVAITKSLRVSPDTC